MPNALKDRILKYTVAESDFALLAGIPESTRRLTDAESLALLIKGLHDENNQGLVLDVDFEDTIEEGWHLYAFEVTLKYGTKPNVADAKIAEAIDNYCDPRSHEVKNPTELTSAM